MAVWILHNLHTILEIEVGRLFASTCRYNVHTCVCELKRSYVKNTNRVGKIKNSLRTIRYVFTILSFQLAALYVIHMYQVLNQKEKKIIKTCIIHAPVTSSRFQTLKTVLRPSFLLLTVFTAEKANNSTWTVLYTTFCGA